MEKGIVCEIERYAINDGPGIRTLIFLKGCPLRCKWCSNPETQKLLPEIYYYSHRCIFCRSCVAACPAGAIQDDFVNRLVVTDRAKCTGCGRCTLICPNGARSIVGIEMTVSQVFEEIKKDIPFYISSSGGVTVTGGEVFVQRDFACEILKKCKEEYIDTAIETSGYVPWEDFEKLLKYVDHVLIDVKHMDSLKHLALTGVRNEIILENIKKLDEVGADYVLRIPLIPGMNDGEDNFERFYAFVEDLKNLREVHLLPYHTLGRSKYNYLERVYEMPETPKPSQDKIENIQERLNAIGVNVVVGG